MRKDTCGRIAHEHRSHVALARIVEGKLGLNDGQLTLVWLEIDNLPRFRVQAGQAAFDFTLELFLRNLLGFVHPGRIIESLPVPSRYPPSCCRGSVGRQQNAPSPLISLILTPSGGDANAE
jgi:hypothetical protein